MEEEEEEEEFFNHYKNDLEKHALLELNSFEFIRQLFVVTFCVNPTRGRGGHEPPRWVRA